MWLVIGLNFLKTIFFIGFRVEYRRKNKKSLSVLNFFNIQGFFHEISPFLVIISSNPIPYFSIIPSKFNLIYIGNFGYF